MIKKLINRLIVWASDKPAPAPVEPKAMKINPALLGSLQGQPAPEQREFVPYDPPPGVIPNNLRAQTLAMDSTDYGLLNQSMAASSWAYGSFPGYPYLAMLSQLPEYRDMCGTLAAHMTRKFIKVVSIGNGDNDEKIAKMEEALLKFKIQDLFKQAATQDNFFGRGQIYIDMGLPGSVRVPAYINSAELETPLLLDPAKIPKGSLRGFTLVEPVWTYPSTYNSDNPLAPNYYRPSQWYVMGKAVHSTRLLMFASRPVPDMLKSAYNFGGISLCQLAEPYVNNWVRTRDSVAEIIRSFSISGVLTNLSAELQGEDSTGKGMLDRALMFNAMRDNRGLFMLDKETEEFFQYNTPLSSLDKLQAQSQEQMAAVSKIPLVYLLGITPAGLNASSEGETKVFGETIRSMQEGSFTEPLNIVFSVIQLSEFGELWPEIGYEFEALEEMNEVEQATIRKTDADTDAVLIGAGVIDPDDARARIAADPQGGYHGLELNEGGAPDPDDEDPPGGMAADAGFNEGDHPRDASGKFAGGSMEYQVSKGVRDVIEGEVKKHSDILNAYPKTGPFGMVPDDIKFSPEYQQHYANYQRAFSALQNHNVGHVKKFKKEIQAERNARMAAGLPPGGG